MTEDDLYDLADGPPNPRPVSILEKLETKEK